MTTELIIEKQLIAYNAGNYAEFASCYHPNIVSYDLVTMQVIPQMCGAGFFVHYQNKLKENPKIHCKVTRRIVHGNLVVDQEIISSYQNQQHSELVIYQVEEGLISKMWFNTP